MKNELIARILRAVASLAERANEAELESLLNVLRTKDFSGGVDGSRKKPPKNRHAKIDPVELERVLKEMIGFSTREDGQALLDRLDLGRKELEKLARLRSIYITKSDDIPKIKEKLIEVIIGSRLNSKAIRGDSTS